ncbi:MAG: phosphoribosyl-ATP diphosphatase [Hyphomicrobiales bacterium]|nr:phosphoribosyl-ATP diphosphatase [Hyphomicrobiales bacterium]
MTQAFTLPDLAALIASRQNAVADTSYTRSLLDAGLTKCARKFAEEATELVIAAVERDKKAITLESADVLYHLLVVLHAGNVSLSDVMDELSRRTGQSGLQEKAGRSKPAARP